MSERIALFTALYNALAADAALKATIEAGRGVAYLASVPVYADRAPPDEVAPYLTFNDVSDDAWDTSETFGAEIVFDVHAWSETSRLEVETLIGRTRILLQDPAWTLSGFTLVYCRPLRARVDSDGEYFHGVCTARAIVGHL